MPIVLKGFGSEKFVLLDLVDEIPEFLVFQHDFLNFFIQESMFGFLDKFPIF